MHELRVSDRTPVCYTMKTSARHSPAGVTSNPYSHSRSNSQSVRTGKGSKSSTPLVSPKPYSVGQSHAPKLSPGRPDINRAPSPSYFGLVVESPTDGRDSVVLPRENWSSPSSSVASFTAALPGQVPIPLEANPDYDAFRRQADLNRGIGGGGGFSLSGPRVPQPVGTPLEQRPRPPRWNTSASDASMAPSFIRPASRMDVDQGSLRDSAYVSSDSKRGSQTSLPPQILPIDMPRFESPRPSSQLERRTTLSRAEDRDPRLSVMEHRVDPPPASSSQAHRADTEPPRLDHGPSMVTPGQLKELIEGQPDTSVMLIDLRSLQNYTRSRIQDALNLCIPTTLLKRATFNLQKLQQTFQSPDDREKFSHWRETDCLVVYDAYSAEKRDAVTAMNMIKKFTMEGYRGSTHILRGGFNSFAEEYPELLDENAVAGTGQSPFAVTGPGSRQGLAPVIGGVMLPTNHKTPNPFFSNIRQNIDLADGVGQMDVHAPNGLQSNTLPQWLREAAEPQNHGKRVSEKFLDIELEEQSRMKNAYSTFNQDAKGDASKHVQLSGIEQGVKNRYKDILPFEHARVKLKGQADGACDYVNASHIHASGSFKHYIASQGPLPATFDDFWSVIWDQDVRVVVMLTAESEGGQLKCHPYWKGKDYGSIKLKLLSEKKVSLDIDRHRSDSATSPSSGAAEAGRRRANTTTTLENPTPASQSLSGQGDTPYVILRKFALAHTAHPFAPIREITHLHFPGWPDFGAPAQPVHLLALVELANVMQRAALPAATPAMGSTSSPDAVSLTWFDEPEADANSRPMLVHCSAGCGRTGTFCAVDSVIDMLKRQRLAKISQAARAKKDADGDVAMVDDESTPPHPTHRQPSYPTSRRRSGDGKRGSGGGTPSIDVSWLDDDAVDLIQRTVEDFRGQRLSMVQSLRQFVLCYETVLEWLWRLQQRSAQRGVDTRGRARSGSLQARK